MVFAGIKNPLLMIIVAVYEFFNKKYAWDTLLLSNNKEAPKEATKKT